MSLVPHVNRRIRMSDVWLECACNSSVDTVSRISVVGIARIVVPCWGRVRFCKDHIGWWYDASFS